MDDDRLTDWDLADRSTVSQSSDAMVRRLLEAVANGECLSVIYHGGSTPGGRRKIRPQGVFQVSGYGGTSLKAYCEKRGEVRTFRADRLEIPGVARSPGPALTGYSTGPRRRHSSERQSSTSQGTGCLISMAILLLQAAAVILAIFMII